MFLLQPATRCSLTWSGGITEAAVGNIKWPPLQEFHMYLSPALIGITLWNNGAPASLSLYVIWLIPGNLCRLESTDVRACVRTNVCDKKVLWILYRRVGNFKRKKKKKKRRGNAWHHQHATMGTLTMTLLPQFERTRKAERTERHGPVCLSLSSCLWWPCLTLYPFWNRSLQDFFRLHVSGRVSKWAPLCACRYTSSFGGIMVFTNTVSFLPR